MSVAQVIHVGGFHIASNGGPVQSRECAFASEVDVCPSKEQWHDALHMAIPTAGQPQQSV